jgi:hypothetical protein
LKRFRMRFTDTNAASPPARGRGSKRFMPNAKLAMGVD